jgi:Flp pilus assembly protein TadD
VHTEITALSNDGLRLAQSSDRDGAERQLRQALALAERHLGADDPMTGVCLSNLGDFLGQDGRTEEAESLMRRAVAAEERLHGPEALETAYALNNLALVLRRAGRLAEAEALYRRVLPIFERGPGPESPEAASVMNNLAQVCQHSGRSEHAEPLMRRVIEVFERQRGPRHPDVAVALNNLARLLEDSGRAREAEPLSRRHLRIFQEHENETGRPHRHKRAAIAAYGDLLLALGLDRRRAQQRIDDLLLGREVHELPDPASPAATAPDDAGPAETPDFDRLSAFADDAGASIDDQNALFRAAFRLNEWYFVARGELPDVRPYVASNPTIAGGAPMVKAFTDTRRLHAYARENALTGPEGDVQILALPVHTILFTTADLETQGVTHIHFNGDAASHGFYIPLAQLPLVQRHLKRLGLVPG